MQKDTTRAEYALAQRNLAIVCTGVTAADEKYKELLGLSIEARLFKRTYGYYGLITAIALIGIVGNFYSMTIAPGFGWQVLNGIIFGFWSIQLGMIAHDLSHSAVFLSPKKNRLFSMLIWCLIGGLSERRWFEKHNAHHQHPNHEGHDPDLDIPFIVSPNQAEGRTQFFTKYILPNQHILFWIVLPFVYFWNIFHSLRHLFTNMDVRAYVEVFLMILHFIILFSLTFTLLPFVSGVAFLIATFITMGLYMSLVFAPNHKGEEVLLPEAQFLWTHQITNTNNVKPGLLTFYLMGGLNFQIEHHLFPTMPRLQYFKVQKIVKQYCLKENIEYHETSWIESMKQIHEGLKSAQV